MWEGTLPKLMSPKLVFLAMAGQPGDAGALVGPLPVVLARCKVLVYLSVSWQSLDGVIPPLAGRIRAISLQSNNFKLMSDVWFDQRKNDNSIMIHNNQLSCAPPQCGKQTVKISLSALGNELSRLKQGFPFWVSPMDRDRLFWTTHTEGVELLVKVIVASTFLALAVAPKRHGCKLWKWHSQPGHHAKLAFQCYSLFSCFVRGALLRVLFLMLLLSWDLYKCPRAMTLASACLHDDILTHVVVLLMWGYLGFHGSAVRLLTGHTDKKAGAHGQSKERYLQPTIEGHPWLPGQTAKQRQPPLLSMMFVLLQVVLSLPSIILQVCKCVPGGLGIGGDWVGAMISTCIGAIQAVLLSFVIPLLAGKFTSHKHGYVALANLLLNVVFPATVIICLDTSCFGQWVTFLGALQRESTAVLASLQPAALSTDYDKAT